MVHRGSYKASFFLHWSLTIHQLQPKSSHQLFWKQPTMFKRNSAIPMPHHDVTKPDPLADVTLEVEGHKIYTSKYLLANISPKLLEICTKTSEKAGALSIAGNVLNVRAMVQLLAWALPSERVVVSGTNGMFYIWVLFQVDGLVQERRNSIALAMELRLSCTNPSKWRLCCQKNGCSAGMSNRIPQFTVWCSYLCMH